MLMHDIWSNGSTFGSWNSNFTEMIKALLRDHPKWAEVGHIGSSYTQKAKPMLVILRAFYAMLLEQEDVAKGVVSMSGRFIHINFPSIPERFRHLHKRPELEHLRALP